MMDMFLAKLPVDNHILHPVNIITALNRHYSTHLLKNELYNYVI